MRRISISPGLTEDFGQQMNDVAHEVEGSPPEFPSAMQMIPPVEEILM